MELRTRNYGTKAECRIYWHYALRLVEYRIWCPCIVYVRTRNTYSHWVEIDCFDSYTSWYEHRINCTIYTSTLELYSHLLKSSMEGSEKRSFGWGHWPTSSARKKHTFMLVPTSFFPVRFLVVLLRALKFVTFIMWAQNMCREGSTRYKSRYQVGISGVMTTMSRPGIITFWQQIKIIYI